MRLIPLVFLACYLSSCKINSTNIEDSTSLSLSSTIASSVQSDVEDTSSIIFPAVGSEASSSNPADNNTQTVLVDELTLVVLTLDNKPVPNINIYAHPTQGSLLASSESYATTDNSGIAVLQRVRTGEEPNEVITVGLADRNQSDTIQQTITVAMPDSGSAYEPQTIVWNKTLPTDYLKEQTDTITLTIVDTVGKALPNMWVKLGLPSRTAPDGSNNDMGYQEDLPYADRYLISGADGTCTFANVPNGLYSVGLWGGSPPFNLVASDNPLLQAEIIYSDKSIWGTTIDYAGGRQSFTLEFVPYLP